jgi:c-di-GMP-binding flagellar brake protein YcgR
MRKKKEAPVPTQERRSESRIQEEDKVSIELLSNVDLPISAKTINALTKDISPGGVRIMAKVDLPVGTVVRMEIVLSNRRKLLQVVGVVRWCRSVYEESFFEMGIEFTEIAPEDKMTLLEHAYRNRKQV